MAHKHATGVIYTCGASTSGEFVMQDSLMGKKVANLYGSRSQLAAVTDGGVVDILTSKKISESRFGCLSFGQT